MRVGMATVAALLVACLAAPAVAKEKTRAEPIKIKQGLPKASGLGQLVIATNLRSKDKRWKAVKAYAKDRGAKTLRFKERDVTSLVRGLSKIGPEFVAYALDAETLDTNFHYAVLELSRDLDDDPMPDFHFGYLVARDAEDMTAWLDRMRTRHAKPLASPVSKMVPLTNGDFVLPLDFALHFGHGMPWGVNGGLQGKDVGALQLTRAPVIWSGACFNAVVSRSYHTCAYQRIWMTPTPVTPEQALALNWVHAGILGFVAALEGDRGEMASVEWNYFFDTGCTLGEAIGHQYRLAFTSLDADFKHFPRHRNRYKKRMSFYDVMLRGAVSRVLFGDPSLRPISAPTGVPTQHVETIGPASPTDPVVRIEVSVPVWKQFSHQNYLPLSNKGSFDNRITARVAVPEGWPPLSTTAQIALWDGENPLEVTRHHVRHEVWGGQRYVNLQVEMPRVPKGTRAVFRFNAPD